MNRFACALFFIAQWLIVSPSTAQTYFDWVCDEQVKDFFRHADLARPRVKWMSFKINKWRAADLRSELLLENPNQVDSVPESVRNYFPGFDPAQWRWAADSLKTDTWDPVPLRVKWVGQKDWMKREARMEKRKLYDWSFSVPLFNDAANAAIIKSRAYCGPSCGESMVRLFVRDEKGRWREVDSWNGVEY